MTPAADVLEARGLSLPLIHTADGPRLKPGGEYEALAELVNGFLNGLFEADARSQLGEGGSVSRGGVYARAVPDGLGLTEEGAAWRRATGSDLDDDPVMAGSSVTGAFVLPRAALLEILDRMLDLRAQAIELSDGPPSPAAAMDDKAAPLLGEAPPGGPPAGAPGRAQELSRLEERARELAAMADPAEAAARRRTLLIELDVLGLLSGGEPLAGELRTLRLPVLSGYHAAARRVLAYLVSEERHALVPEGVAGGVLGAPISLDWFRRAHAIDEGVTEDGWTALGEAMLSAAVPKPMPEGMFYAQWAGRWYTVYWRRDDGTTPALLELTRP